MLSTRTEIWLKISLLQRFTFHSFQMNPIKNCLYHCELQFHSCTYCIFTRIPADIESFWSPVWLFRQSKSDSGFLSKWTRSFYPIINVNYAKSKKELIKWFYLFQMFYLYAGNMQIIRNETIGIRHQWFQNLLLESQNHFRGLQ